MISFQTLETLIAGLEQCRDEGVQDPWLLEDGRIVEPLEVLYELRDWRLKVKRGGVQ